MKTPQDGIKDSQKSDAEEILDKWLKDYPWKHWSKENVLKAMEEYASQSGYPEELQQLMNDISEWSDKTFGECQRNPAILHHLVKEVPELIEAIIEFQNTNSVVHVTKSERNLNNVFYEYADCFMLLIDSAAHMGLTADMLINYTKKKLEINKKRRWGKPDKNGVVEHIG